MKGRMKRFVVSCMTMLGISIMLPGTVNAQQNILEPEYVEENYETYDAVVYTRGNYKYEVENGVATIIDYLGSETNVTVPVVLGPNPVKKIGKGAFDYKNDSIRSITISEGIETLSSYGISQLPNLESVHLPSTLRLNVDNGSGEEAIQFYKCNNLKTITVHENNIDMMIYDGDLYSKDMKTFLYHPNGSTKEKVVVADGVTKIASGASRFNSFLKSVVLPNTVKWIGDCAFENTKIKKVDIPKSCTIIGFGAFFRTELEKIDIPLNVTEIGGHAFGYISTLKEIVFLGDAPKIGDNAFNDLTTIVYYPSGNATWTKEVRQDYFGKSITWKALGDVCETPAKPYKITNVVHGVHVYWEEVRAAAKYGLWRSETGQNGTYKWVANPTVPHFTDTEVTSGKTYYYKVTALSYSNKHSEKSAPIGITYVSTPDITNRVNKAAGVQLGWNKITGATGYAVYRKSYSGSDDWVRVATISGNSMVTWTDETVKNNNGTIYKYTVRALAGSDKKTLSGCQNAGRTMVRLASRVLNSATKASANSIKCEWTTSSAVTGYEVRFMEGDKVVKTVTVGNYKTGAKTFNGLVKGKKYKVQVRSYKKVEGVGSFYSAWSVAKYVQL